MNSPCEIVVEGAVFDRAFTYGAAVVSGGGKE